MFFLKLYIHLILILIFVPLSLISKILYFNNKSKSNFNDFNKANLFKFLNYSFYSKLSLFLFLFLFPLIIMKNYSKKIIFKPKKKIIIQTPKQIASFLAYRVISNLKIINKISTDNKAKYHFILQPLLFASTNKTKLDKKIINYVGNTKYQSFDYANFCIEYYNYLLLGLKQENEMLNNYSDFSDIFKNVNNQRFVDPVHFGSIGQSECEKIIGDKLISQEKKTNNKL